MRAKTAWDILWLLKALNLPRCEKEYKFHPTRKWRFDFCYPDQMIAIEYEGIFAGKSRHTNLKGYTADCEKYNEAALMGWKVLRFTAKSLQDGTAMNQLQRAFGIG